MEVSGQFHHPAALAPGERVRGIHWTGGWVGPKNWYGRCGVEKDVLPLPGIEPRPSSPYPIAKLIEPSWVPKIQQEDQNFVLHVHIFVLQKITDT
jgi:hypothetical protein